MINWKLRFRNKATLLSLAALVVGFVYQVSGVLGFVPPISEDQITQLIGIIINILAAAGVIVDPTTRGIGDSVRAMGYDVPRKEEDHA